MVIVTAEGNRHLNQQNYTSGPASLGDAILAFVSSESPKQVTTEEIENVFFEFPRVSEAIEALVQKGRLRS